ncbi:hypothetical protein TCAL_03604 [Tigriopus californicus]|uniref:F-box domain-containing protein n=1 Tax=Tigriopus californicus TaxID=6832 RepID=A0A553NB41_TIGCA|nr:hypothetical protein TCAL_03604 [Tigriopus californicus]
MGSFLPGVNTCPTSEFDPQQECFGSTVSRPRAAKAIALPFESRPETANVFVLVPRTPRYRSVMDHSLSRSASSGVLTAGHRRPSAESLSERNSPFKDTGQPGAHSHKVLSLTAMNAAKQEAATNGNHSPVTGKPESNPIWNRVNGFQNTPASLALQSKNVPGLCEGRSALNNKPMFNGTPLMAEVESATHPVSLGQCKSDNIEANGRPQSGGSPVVSRAETAPIGLRFPSDAKYTRHDQLIAETGQSVDTNSSGKSDISSQSRANEVISPFLHIPLEGSNSKKCPSVPQSLTGQLGASVSEASQTNNPIELTSSCEVSGDNGVPPLTSPEDSEPKSMKACSVKLVDISGGVKKEPSPPPRAVIDQKIGLPGQNAPSRESLKRESPTNFKRSTCEPVVKKTKDELLPPPPQQQHKQQQQQQPQPQQPCGSRNSSPNSSRSVPVTNQRDPIPTLTSSSSSSSSSPSQASTLSSPSKEKNQGLDQSYKSKWHLKEDNSLPTSTNNGSPLKTSSSSNTIESKVTISPVRKESKCGLSSSGQPGGSVTITKLSTGSSQRIESKDLKKQNPTDRSTASTTSSTSSSSSHLIASSIPNRPNLENGHHTSGDLNTSSSLNKAPRKSSHSYSVEMQRKKDKKSASVSGTPLSTGSNFPSGVSPSGQPSMAQVKKPRDEVCNSCKVEFSTREALHLHTCNSKLDQHYLTENQVRASEARRGDKSANSSPRNLSRNNSRSNSPVSQHNSSSNSSSNIPSHLQSSSVAKANQRMNSDSEFKLVNNTKDELMIEGRPKITVSKVVGSTKTSGGEDSESRKPIIPKIKLSASVNAKGSSSSNSSPVATPTLIPPQPLSSFSLSSSSASSSPPESRAINSMLDSSPLSSLKRKFGDNSSKLDTPSFNGKIKLKIPGNITNAMSSAISASDSYSAFGSGPGHSAKDAGSTLDSSKVPPSSTRPSESNIGQQYLMSKKKEEEAAGYAFAFAGRPTYSPSRIEPSSSHVPEKESPRDASNKDSPASQADSGVFSIASSNSPSKGESANSGTSPDSPTRYSDVQWKPPGSKTTVTTPTESPNGSGPTQSLASLNASAPFNQSASNQNTSPGDAPGIASKGFFPGQAFFNSSNEPPVKRKRGRPRKNPMKEPGAPKRTYNRKKKTAPVIEGNSDSVYNFDEEEQDGLLPMRPRKAPSAHQQQQAKKFPFGTDEEMSKGLKMGGIARGNGNGAPPGPPNHMMGGYAHNSMQMSMPQQQQYMMNQNRHNMNPHMQRQQQQQHMQQQQLPQHQNNMSNENSQDCSYSSEVLKEAHPPSSRMHNPGSVESNHTMSPNPMNHQSPYHHMNSPSNPHPGNHQQISSQMHSPSQNSGNFGQVGVSPHSQQHGASGGMSNFSQGQMSHPMQSPYNGMNGTFPNGAPMTSRYRMPGAVPNNYQEMNSETSNASGFYGQQGNNFGNMSMNTMGSNGMSGYGAMNHQRFGMSNSQFHGPHNYPQQMRQMGNSYGNEQFGNIYANQGQFPGMGFNNPRMGMGHHQGQGGMIGHGGNMGHNMQHHQFRPNMGMGPGPMNSMGNVGSPRISPNHPNMPMPGVGMPRVSPSMASRQPTPLVSPQSDNSPASHQNPLTPGSYHQPHTPSGPTHYGGPITPASNHNPMTPANSNAPPTHHHHHHHHPPGSVSPMTPNNPRTPQNFGGPPSQTPSSMVAPSPKQEPLVSPAPAYDDLASPSSSGASNLRKIRRPSKPNQPDPPSISPRAEIKAEPLPVKVEPSPPKVEPQPPRVEETKTKSEPAAQAPKPKPKQLGPKPQHKYLDIPAPIYEEKKIVVKVKKEIEKSDFVARWSELPPKALRLLFRCGVANEGAIPFLVRVSRVCKSWNKEAMDPTIWTHLDLSSGKMKEKYRNDKKLETFLKKYPNVLELKLTGWKNSVGTSTLKMISMVCPKLISLGLASCFKLSNEDVKLIAESYEKLERIDLSNVSSSSCSSRSAVSSSCLTELVTLVGKRLTHFNISNNKMAGLPFVFKALTSHSSNLEEIDISNITTTSREAIPMNVEKFQKSCPKLRVLNANHTMLNLTENPIKEQIQSPGFPFLQELHIAVDSRGYFEGMDDGQIERILKKSDKLKALDIRGCQHVSDSCLIRLPTWEMEKLVLSGCSAASASSDGLELMVKKWAATLLEMDVSFTPGERTVNFMVDEFADANEFSIRKLNLSGTAIKLKSLTKLLKKCDTLEYINLNSCRGLPRGMKRLHGTREALLKLKDDIEEGKFNEDDSDD